MRTYGELALREAFPYVRRDVKEHPPNSNTGKEVRWFQSATTLAATDATGWPWCMAFRIRMLLEVGFEDPYRTASVGLRRDYFRKKGWIRMAQPRSGDEIYFDYDTLTGPGKGDWPDHVGVFAAQTDVPQDLLAEAIRRFGKLGEGEFWSVEGNTGIGNDSNGGQCMLRKRSIRMVEAYGRLPDKPPRPSKPAWELVVGSGKDARVIGTASELKKFLAPRLQSKIKPGERVRVRRDEQGE